VALFGGLDGIKTAILVLSRAVVRSPLTPSPFRVGARGAEGRDAVPRVRVGSYIADAQVTAATRSLALGYCLTPLQG
jgi:hypothetical protein